MDKYYRKWLFNEKIPNCVNDLELSILLFDFKRILVKQNDFIKFNELSNFKTIKLMLIKFYKYNDKEKQYLKNNILNKFNQTYLYEFFIKLTCELLLEKDYEMVEDVLKSFVALDLVKEANLSKDKMVIELTLLDDTRVNYSHVPLDKDLLDAYKTYCHEVTLGFLKNIDNSQALVVLLDKELCGKYYHSLYMHDGIVYDLAHNILIRYENYVKLFNPTILINEDKDTILSNIKDMKENNKKFSKSKFVDILKYAIECNDSNKKYIDYNGDKEKIKGVNYE